MRGSPGPDGRVSHFRSDTPVLVRMAARRARRGEVTIRVDFLRFVTVSPGGVDLAID